MRADFTIDGTHVYFSELNPGSIQQMPIAGGTPTPLAPGALGTVLVNDTAHLYWIDPALAQVLQFPKSGGASTNPVAFPLASATDPSLALDCLAVDSNGLYLQRGAGREHRILFLASRFLHENAKSGSCRHLVTTCAR